MNKSELVPMPDNKVSPQIQEVNIAGRDGGIEVPLMKGEIGSPLINILAFSDITLVVEEGTRVRPSTVHFFGSSNCRNRELLERGIVSDFFCVNDSPLQSGLVAAPLGNAFKSGLGKLTGWESILC